MQAAITAAAFVLAAPDAAASTRWWTDESGFEKTRAMGGWRFVRRGMCELRPGSCPDALPAADTGDHSDFAYLVVDDLDAPHARVGPSMERLFAPIDQPWGIRELGPRTPDGHRFMLAQAIG